MVWELKGRREKTLQSGSRGLTPRWAPDINKVTITIAKQLEYAQDLMGAQRRASNTVWGHRSREGETLSLLSKVN